MNIIVEKPELTNYQKDILYSDSRFTITEASTKVGKTFSHIFWIYERAHQSWNKVNYNHWWIAPVYAQAKIAFNRLRAIVGRSGLYKINESNLMITCPNGAIIHFKSADKPDNLFGEDVYSIVFDEAPRAKVDAFYALRSTITATGGQMKLIGNFGGSANWMHQLKEKAKTDKKYSYFKITAWDAVREGILEEEEILQAQRDLPPKIFKQLYLAEEQESDDQLISFNAMNDLFTNEFALKGTKYITADIALHGSDKFVVCVWDGWRLIEITIIGKIEAPEVEKLLKDKAEKFEVMRSNIAYDADGLGSFLRGYLKGATPFNNGGKPIKGKTYKNLKTECGYEFAKHINAGGMKIDCDIDRTLVFKELECLQSYKLDDDGKIQLLPKAKIKELIGHSPDILDAFVMRSYFDVKPDRSQWGRSTTT
ncbi:terminase large subunit domain-containing protein [Epilithonimonas sp. UC225_85]|uniref:terminase large subunit domain-containing protein n=1 Tax=Epilithonimonas sp. UC225_85 TaxID=3350167 RepID=UPI0036D35512